MGKCMCDFQYICQIYGGNCGVYAHTKYVNMQKYAKLLADNLSVSGTNTPVSRQVKNLGVIIDEDLTLYEHITYICNSCYHLCQNNCALSYFCKIGLLQLPLH